MVDDDFIEKIDFIYIIVFCKNKWLSTKLVIY